MSETSPDITVSLVKQLITQQFSQWAHLSVRPVEFGGWDNRTFHLGEEMLVRMPSAARYAAQVKKEQLWLPRLAPQLPLPIPEPLAMGKPGCGYPWNWSVYRWIEGENASRDRISDENRLAESLAEFLRSLQQVDFGERLPAGRHNFYRGGSLSVYDHETRSAIAALRGTADTDAASALWNAAIQTQWQRPPVWVHGDLHASNLLIRNGELAAVIDFGGLGTGDPACDLSITWTFFAGESRNVFRQALSLDEGTWLRGKAWTLWKALILLVEYESSHPVKANEARRVLEEVLADR